MHFKQDVPDNCQICFNPFMFGIQRSGSEGFGPFPKRFGEVRIIESI